MWNENNEVRGDERAQWLRKYDLYIINAMTIKKNLNWGDGFL